MRQSAKSIHQHLVRRKLSDSTTICALDSGGLLQNTCNEIKIARSSHSAWHGRPFLLRNGSNRQQRANRPGMFRADQDDGKSLLRSHPVMGGNQGEETRRREKPKGGKPQWEKAEDPPLPFSSAFPSPPPPSPPQGIHRFFKMNKIKHFEKNKT